MRFFLVLPRRFKRRLPALLLTCVGLLVLAHFPDCSDGVHNRDPGRSGPDSIPAPRPPRPFRADKVHAWLTSPAVSGIPGRDYFLIYYDRAPQGGRAVDYAGRGRVYDGHTGSDFGLSSMDHMDEGVPVLAVADGIVREIQDGNFDRQVSRGKGRADNFVVIDHGGGRFTRYRHLRKGSVAVKPDDRVRAGHQIALVGSAGDSAFPHLHLDVIENGRSVDPFGLGTQSRWSVQPEYLPFARVSDAGLTRWHLRKPWPWVPGRIQNIPSGSRGLVAWAFLLQDRSGRPRQWRLVAPYGKVIARQAFKQPKHVHVRTAYWNLGAVAFTPGLWRVQLWERDLRDSREKRLLDMPVCAGPCPTVPPGPPPVALFRQDRIYLCEVTTENDDIVGENLGRLRYEYRWSRGATILRKAITGQRGDVLPVQDGQPPPTCSVRAINTTGLGPWSTATNQL